MPHPQRYRRRWRGDVASDGHTRWAHCGFWCMGNDGHLWGATCAYSDQIVAIDAEVAWCFRSRNQWEPARAIGVMAPVNTPIAAVDVDISYLKWE